MKRYMAVIVLSILTFALADEIPCTPGTQAVPTETRVQQDQADLQSISPIEPVWSVLQHMPLEERQNSEIDIELGKQTSVDARYMAQRIEGLWNCGQYEDALLVFPQLSMFTDVREMAIGTAWRSPLLTRDEVRWANDVRIGNRDSITCCELDIDVSSGNLFAVLLFQEGTNWRWSVNFSTNSGSSWSETYAWSAAYPLWNVDAAVVYNHCYVAYGSGSTSARVRRFKVVDAQADTFPNGASNIVVQSTSSPDSIEEVSLESNQDSYDNRLYYMTISTQGNLRLSYDTPEAITWYEISVGIDDASRGLDVSWNHGYADYFLLISYYNMANNLIIRGWDGTTLASDDHTKKITAGIVE